MTSISRDVSGFMHGVRMRAERDGRHVSGAERIVTEAEIDAVVGDLSRRGRDAGADTVRVTVERIARSMIARVACAPVWLAPEENSVDASAAAINLLTNAGVEHDIARQALEALEAGLGPGGAQLRGASIWDRTTGRQCEPDHARGARATRMDFSAEGRAALDLALGDVGLTHFRTREALAVATKALWAGATAEICWSDAPGYAAGYVAIRGLGYVRYANFKPPGAAGGRIWFVGPDADIGILMERAERACALIDLDPGFTIVRLPAARIPSTT